MLNIEASLVNDGALVVDDGAFVRVRKEDRALVLSFRRFAEFGLSRIRELPRNLLVLT